MKRKYFDLTDKAIKSAQGDTSQYFRGNRVLDSLEVVKDLLSTIRQKDIDKPEMLAENLGILQDKIYRLEVDLLEELGIDETPPEPDREEWKYWGHPETSLEEQGLVVNEPDTNFPPSPGHPMGRTI